MKKGIIFIFVMLFLNVSFCQVVIPFESKFSVHQLSESPANLIPFPQKVTWNRQYLAVDGFNLPSGKSITPSSKWVLQEISSFYDLDPLGDKIIGLDFKTDKTLIKEAYQLIIDYKGIDVVSNSESGKFYALQTLKQLFQKVDDQWSLPFCDIKDWPAFPVRGYMIDVGRNFQSMASLKKQLDILARYKMNVFHWHLTDRPAWRIQSDKYPELIDPVNHRKTRDPGKYYSYDDIRELIKYAKERHITVIPEIDMPGHSDSFIKSTGVKMESEEGMKILENVLNEFFDEIPVRDCPIIHIGSDEVRIPNPEAFISKMVSICEDRDRQVVIWNPGLNASDNVIRQTWQTKHVEKGNFKEIDSWNNYINNGEPMTQVMRLFFKPIGYPSQNEVIGGILCFWPDVNMDNEGDAYYQNPVYPSILTYAWKTWTNDVTRSSEKYYTTLPEKGSVALEYFGKFEEYLLHHKQRYFSGEPFQYLKQSDKYWRVIGPLPQESGDHILAKDNNEYTINGETYSWKEAVGNTIVVKDRFKLGGHYPDAQVGQTVYGITYIQSNKEKSIEAWIGFETPLRANRTYTGIPEKGSWDPNGGTIWINDELLPAPDWNNPGWKPSKTKGWGARVDQEIPWRKEELYWTRNPISVHLKKGWNKVVVKSPSSTDYQNWMFTFAPMDMEGLKFSNQPSDHSTYYYQKKTHFESIPDEDGEILFIGDSMTDGCEWSEVFGNSKVKNRGISGDVVQGVIDRLSEIVASQPRKIFLMIGVNDVARGREADYIVDKTQLIIDRINEYAPGTKIYLQSLLPVNDYFGMFSGHTSKNHVINEVNEGLANLSCNNLTFINLHPNFVGKDNKLDTTYTNDGLHLKGEGYELWASLIGKYVK
jgi:lysophospholipase L1-like esterase